MNTQKALPTYLARKVSAVKAHAGHYACFRCRKMFNKPSYAESPALLQRQYPTSIAFRQYQPFCPQCRTPMTNMGNGFKPPRHNDLRRWRILEREAKVGRRFWYTPSWL